jgi:hypothetical protein
MTLKSLEWNEMAVGIGLRLKVASGTEAEVDATCRGLARQLGLDCWIVRGRRCGSVGEVFREFAAALQFPFYFADNWDSFDECMNDLSWLGGSAVRVVVVAESEKLLGGDPSKRRRLADICADAVGAASVPLYIVFQCDGDSLAEVARDLGVGPT